jgi:hypothetical protein
MFTTVMPWASGGHRDQLEVGQLLQGVGPHRDLVDQRDLGALQALDDLVRRPGRLVLDVFVRKVELTDLGVQGLAVEEHDLLRHGILWPIRPGHG